MDKNVKTVPFYTDEERWEIERRYEGRIQGYDYDAFEGESSSGVVYVTEDED